MLLIRLQNLSRGLGGRGLALALLLVFLLVIGAVLLDYWSARRELTAMARDHAEQLTAAIERSGANALLAMSTIEDFVLQRLLSVARMIRTVAESEQLGQTELHGILSKDTVDVAVVWQDGRPLAYWPASPPRSWLAADPALRSVMEGDSVEVADFFSAWDGEWYRAIVPVAKGSAVAVGLGSDRLLSFRKQVGVGTLIRSLARTAEIEYIALQDTLGIIAATGNVRSLSRIEADVGLLRALREGLFVWRESSFAGHRVFEAVRPFPLGEGEMALLRVGVSQAPLRSAQMRMISRILISTFVLLFAGALGLAYLWTRQLATETERAYHRVRSLSTGILERMGDGVVAVDGDGRLQWANPAAQRILGISAHDVGTSIRERAPKIMELLRRALETGTPVEEGELTCRVRGRERILAASASVLRGKEDEAEMAFAVFRDLTERVRLERQLARERRLTAMGQLASGIAHEIRNPLNAVSVIAQRLAREFVPRSDQQEYNTLTRTLVTETRRVNEIVQQFLEFARPPKLNKRPTDLRTVVQQSVNLMRSAAEEKGIRLVFEGSQGIHAVVDPVQLKQALDNLIQNAIQVCSEGDEIRVELAADEEEVRISVQDTGPGIPRDVLPKIFDLYFTTRSQGTGIGLSLVHRIVSAHDGSVEVESEEGAGARFVLHLPRGTQA